MKAVRRSIRWAVGFFAALLINLSPYWVGLNVAVAGECAGIGCCGQREVQCSGTCKADETQAEFKSFLDMLSQKKQAYYLNVLDGLPPEAKQKFLRRAVLARSYFGAEKHLWDDRGKAFVFLGPPAHISTSDDVQISHHPMVIAAREAFAARLSSDVMPGYPTFPVDEGVVWENWVYPEIMGGIELTFVDVGSGRFVFAPLPGGLDRPAPTKLIGYQSQFLYEVAKKKAEGTVAKSAGCQAQILASREEVLP